MLLHFILALSLLIVANADYSIPFSDSRIKYAVGWKRDQRNLQRRYIYIVSSSQLKQPDRSPIPIQF